MLEALFRPRSVAVIGASDGVTATATVKISTAAMQALVEHHFPGHIYPINPNRDEVMGLPCYPSVREVPGEVDLAVFVVPAGACIAAMEECAAKGVKAAVVFSSGFGEAGDWTLEQRLVATARAGGVRFVGPNTAGFVDVNYGLVASISMVTAVNPFRAGDIAFITQSGALGGSMLGRAMEQGIGFSHWISTGNEADLSAADYLEFLVDRDEVRVFALFLEGVRDTPRFLAACRKAAAARKPIVVYKTGASEVAAEAARSHTGALAGSDRVFDAVCKQHGLIRVDDVAELFPTALAFSWAGEKRPRGRRLAIVSASGGICGVGADECQRAGLEVPELTEEAKAKVRRFVPSFASVRNPIDVTGQIRASATGYQDTIRTVLAEDYVDGVLLLITMAGEPRASFYGREISALAEEQSKPIMVAWTGPLSLAQQGFPMLARNKVPHFLTVRGAVKTMRALADYEAFLDRPPHKDLERDEEAAGVAKAIIRNALARGERTLSEYDAKRLLAAYGVPTVREQLVADAVEAVRAALRIGFPVVLKGCASDIIHKTERNLVDLDVREAGEVRISAERLLGIVGTGGALLVQEMLKGRREFMVGLKRDAQFGPSVTFGLGGVLTEAMEDVAVRVAPFDVAEAQAMIEETKAARLLSAFRGMPAVNLETLLAVPVALSRIGLDHPEIAEIDVNPLLVAGSQPVAVDALVVLDPR